MYTQLANEPAFCVYLPAVPLATSARVDQRPHEADRFFSLNSKTTP